MGVNFRIVKKLNYFTLDVDFSMGNELLVIEGASGAGKTTILNCLAGTVTPDEGRIAVDDRTLFSHTDKVNVPAEKRNLGYLFQNYALFPNMTVKQNVLYGLKNKKEYRRRESRKELLEYAAYMMETLGISHLVDKSAASISGGEKQRVALARALVNEPKLIIADEPTGNIDPRLSFEIVKLLQEINDQGTTVLMVTHEHDLVREFGGRTITLKDGSIVFDDYI